MEIGLLVTAKNTDAWYEILEEKLAKHGKTWMRQDKNINDEKKQYFINQIEKNGYFYVLGCLKGKNEIGYVFFCNEICMGGPVDDSEPEYNIDYDIKNRLDDYPLRIKVIDIKKISPIQINQFIITDSGEVARTPRGGHIFINVKDDIINIIKMQKNCFIEKTYVTDVPGRQIGDNAMGTALWSPKKSTDGRDIYKNMRLIKKGDVVFHIKDNELLCGVSIVKGSAREFTGMPDTRWAGLDCFRIELENYQELVAPLEKGEFLNETYKTQLDQIRSQYKNLVYNENLNFNEGQYITRAPNELVNIFQDVYYKKTKNTLPHVDYLILLKGRNEIMQNNDDVKKDMKNIILYGPPGTGKTYNSIDWAVKIATGTSSDTHVDNKKEFDRLVMDGQIDFITFHQNYCYEDFVIGLRPDLDESSGLRFIKAEGVFYKLVKRAEINYLNSKSAGPNLKPFDEVFDQFLEPLREKGKEIEVKMVSGSTSFWITEINSSNLSFRKQTGSIVHTLCIETIRGLYGKRRELPGGIKYYYLPVVNELWRLGTITDAQPEKLRNYVLVIDEINRANISKVFGELITLLENDKRIGEKNALRVTLPNGERGFGVPPNLYIIGTMNTADKSIALIDIALRRRFDFIGMYPEIEKIDLESQKVLKHINNALYEKKKTADFLIGHAYFMDQRSIEDTLRKRVIPLLMEYLSGRTSEVSEVFAGSGWQIVYNTDSYNWDIRKN